MCEEIGKFRQNSYFANLCSAAFTLILFFILVVALNPFQANIPNYGKTASFIQHIHGKNFQDYLEWENAFIFGIILNILVGF